MIELNQKPYKKKPGSRLYLSEKLDKPELNVLPHTTLYYTYTRIIMARVNVDYYVPYQYTQKKVKLHIQAAFRLPYIKNQIISHFFRVSS